MLTGEVPAPSRSRGLSATLLRWSLLVTLLLGLGLGALLTVQLAKATRTSMTVEGRQLLFMFEDSARAALQNKDLSTASRVVNGLFQNQAVRVAVLQQADGEVLDERSRPLRTTGLRFLTDSLFGVEQTFDLPLRDDEDMTLGQLRLVLDTAPYATLFADRTLALLSAGVLCIFILLIVFHLVYQLLLARPLAQLLQDMQGIDPEFPGRHQLSVPDVHRNNELGRWVTRINLLLTAIEHNTNKRHETEESLLPMSHVDFLTGLPNRQGLQKKLDRILVAADEEGSMVATLCVGLDGFKLVNEQYSFQQGDWLLRQFSQRVSSQLENEIAIFARLGGDQFIIVQDGVENPYQAAVLAQKVLFMLQQPFTLQLPGSNDEVEVALGATIGITLYPRDAEGSELLLQKAEQTLQLAKLGARNRYSFYVASIDTELRMRRQLEEGLKKAVENRQLHVLYQPQIDYGTGRLVGAEALLRWQHPVHGWIPPDHFIPIAEQSGSILRIGEWVLEQVCQQLARWQAEGWVDLRVAVNLSAVQLHNRGMDKVVERMLATYRIPAACLEFEVTETSLMQNVDIARQHLLELRKLGVGISIDDFGTGHSSLAYLKRLPLDKIKIDRSFVQDVLDNEDDATIVRTVIQLGHSLGLKVLAEGVETVEQQALLIDWGCNEGQGYLYSRPVDEDVLTSMLQNDQVATVLAPLQQVQE